MRTVGVSRAKTRTVVISLLVVFAFASGCRLYLDHLPPKPEVPLLPG